MKTLSLLQAAAILVLAVAGAIAGTVDGSAVFALP